ncbi:MAG: YkgJ family cysteine cluster protein [Nanoarchaeota archaeon]
MIESKCNHGSKCNQCGVCCRLFVINLNEEEYNSRKYKTIFEEFGIVDFEEAELTGANFIAQNEDDSCIYLKDNRCSIHERRPQSCRKFFCDSKESHFKNMIDKINLCKVK